MARTGTHIKVTCPYCGHGNRVSVEYASRRPIIVMCDVDAGPGCGRYFAVQVGWKPVITRFKMAETT